MHAEAASHMHLSWCIPIWMHAASHTGPAQLSSLFTCTAILYQAWISFLPAPSLPLPLPTDVSAWAAISLAPALLADWMQAYPTWPHISWWLTWERFATILIFWELRPRCWEDTLPNLGRTAAGCSFAHLCQWQPDQQVSPSQSLSGVGFPALAQLGPHLRRWALHCVCLSFIPVNLTPETVRCQVPQHAEIQWAHCPRNIYNIYKQPSNPLYFLLVWIEWSD